MLDFFRHKGLTSLVYGAIVVAMILVFVVSFNPSAGKKVSALNEACAARVQGSCIEPKAQKAAYRLLFSRGTAGMRQAVASKIVLEGLIERELLALEAHRLGLTVSEDEITDAIFAGIVHLSLPADNPLLARNLGIDDGRVMVGFKDPKTKQFDMKTYERLVKQLTGRSPTEFRDWQSRELLAAKTRDLVRAPVRVAEDEAFDRYVVERTNATVGYAVIRRAWVEKYGISATARDVEAWAKDKANLAKVEVPVRHILVKFPSDKAEDKEASKKKAEDLLARIKKGEDFAGLAKEHSDDPGSKDKGGQYPGEMVARFVEPFKKTVERLAPGELADTLTETTFGWHIIKRDPASKEDLEKAYKEAKSLEVAKAMAAKIASDMHGAGKSGDEAVKAAIATYGVFKPAPPKAEPVTGDAGAAPAPETFAADTDPLRPQFLSSSAFSKGGDPITAISGAASQAVVDFAFTAKPGDVAADPIATDDGFLVVQLKDRKPATRDDFEKERDTYTQQLLAAKQAEALAFYVRRLREQSKADIKIDESNVFGAQSDAGPAGDDDEGM